MMTSKVVAFREVKPMDFHMVELLYLILCFFIWSVKEIHEATLKGCDSTYSWEAAILAAENGKHGRKLSWQWSGSVWY